MGPGYKTQPNPQFCAISLLSLWTPVSARIPAMVLQLYERNRLKLELNFTNPTQPNKTQTINLLLQ